MLVIKGGKVITLDQRGVIDNAVIILDGPLIKAVGVNIPVPEECTLIDAAGGYILPGFIDAHTHIGLEEEIYAVEGDDVNETSDPVTPELQALDGVNFADLAFADALSGGVTRSVSLPGSANVIGGQAVLLKHLAESASEMIYKNPAGLKAALGENPKRVYSQQKKTPVTRMASASLLREALFVARQNMGKKDLAAREVYRQKPLQAVLERKMPLMLHAHRADDILTALRIKDEFDIDMIIQHGTEAFKVADELIKRDVPVLLGPLLVNRAKVEMKEVSFKNAVKLEQQGVKFSFITDHPVIPIKYLRECAAIAVREGLNEETALKALTIYPAQILKVDDEIGSITAGKRADLVIFDGHPFDFRSRVRHAIVDGILWGDQGE
ncbi:MAG TPA: amidohydrolase [Syntrophomonadaceae bacterium]|nr:amidohydrolase [Syntrophomonadaceae bacterium]HPR94497.1 amidohydrolase [Syntrophomonadaceae bacterium]